MRKIMFDVSGLPPRKGYSYALWNPKNSDSERAILLRRAAAKAFLGQEPLAGKVRLLLSVRAPHIGAGDLANFVNGVCDALQAASPSTESVHVHPEFLKDDAINYQRAIAYQDDK